MGKPGKPRTAGRARVREDADAGVRHCLEMMVAGQWISGQSHAEVGKRYAVSPRTVEAWATSASRVLRLTIEGDVEDIRARMLATVDVILARSMGLTVDNGDGSATGYGYSAKDALSAIDVKAKLLGLMVQKHEVAVTDEEAKKLIAEIKALP